MLKFWVLVLSYKWPTKSVFFAVSIAIFELFLNFPWWNAPNFSQYIASSEIQILNTKKGGLVKACVFSIFANYVFYRWKTGLIDHLFSGYGNLFFYCMFRKNPWHIQRKLKKINAWRHLFLRNHLNTRASNCPFLALYINVLAKRSSRCWKEPITAQLLIVNPQTFGVSSIEVRATFLQPNKQYQMKVLLNGFPLNIITHEANSSINLKVKIWNKKSIILFL